jgi:hypothetical protein
MPRYQLLSCNVAQGGEQNCIVHRGPDDPVTYPELVLLQFIHGGAAVTDAKAVGWVDRHPKEERERLTLLYRDQVVNAVYPGAVSRLPEESDYIDYDGDLSALPSWALPLDTDVPKPDEKPKRKPSTAAQAAKIQLAKLDDDAGDIT